MVFIPKRRRKLLYGQILGMMGEIFHELARRKECKIEEGFLMPDHVHMCISIPPKYAVSKIVGYMKGKQRNFNGGHFWARGYFVTTVGLDEEMVRAYIRHQESEDIRRDQMEFEEW